MLEDVFEWRAADPLVIDRSSEDSVVKTVALLILGCQKLPDQPRRTGFSTGSNHGAVCETHTLNTQPELRQSANQTDPRCMHGRPDGLDRNGSSELVGEEKVSEVFI